MDNTMPTPETTSAPATEGAANPTKGKAKRPARVIKTSTTPSKGKVLTKPAKAAEAPKPPKEKPQHAHLAAGVKTTHYTGLSSYLNDNRKAEPRILPEMATAKLSERTIKALVALREAYGQRQFTVRGFDNNIIAFLRASGLIELSGGGTKQDGNYRRMIDAATPLMGRVTAAGMKFGTVTK